MGNPIFLVSSGFYLIKNIEENKTTIQGYQRITRVLDSTRMGKLSIYYRKNWKVKQIMDNTKDLKYNYYVMAAVYRPVRHSEIRQNFLSVLNNLLRKYINTTAK